MANFQIFRQTMLKNNILIYGKVFIIFDGSEVDPEIFTLGAPSLGPFLPE